MKIVRIIIEKTKDFYSAYAENVEGVYGAGGTPQEVKESILKSIDLLKKHNQDKNIPAVLKGKYHLVFKFDGESILNYYKGIFSNAALERITGINQKQIQHYSTGLKKPRPEQRQKIQEAFHKLGKELISIEL